ncbi:MAG: phage virion morphogenesis protein [Desulfobacula sp.]|jgi:hypothetical protein|nr:phage virion morphogenesis protein [Desulfobacula sp.]
MRITLSGLTGIKGRIKALQNSAFATPMLSEIGMYAMHRIKKRTIKGQDADGIAFKPYNPLYAKERKKAGYQTSTVDLNRTGSMMSSMTYDSDSNSVDLFFMNTSDSTNTKNPAKAFFLQQERNFFALSSEDVKGIMLIVDNYYQRLLGNKGTFVVREKF